jgi:hypothetical protein
VSVRQAVNPAIRAQGGKGWAACTMEGDMQRGAAGPRPQTAESERRLRFRLGPAAASLTRRRRQRPPLASAGETQRRRIAACCSYLCCRCRPARRGVQSSRAGKQKQAVDHSQRRSITTSRQHRSAQHPTFCCQNTHTHTHARLTCAASVQARNYSECVTAQLFCLGVNHAAGCIACAHWFLF